MAYHTFKFLRKRRKDPKWHDEYLSALTKRLWGIVFVFLLIVIFLFVINSNIEIKLLIEKILNRITFFLNN